MEGYNFSLDSGLVLLDTEDFVNYLSFVDYDYNIDFLPITAKS
jgi:hypothetical protein